MADPATSDGRPTVGGPSQPVTVMNPGGGGGTPGAPSSNVTSVQGVTGGTPVPVAGGANAVTTAILQNAATGTGNGTAIDVSGMSTLLLYTTFTATATVTFEASPDDTNWITLTGETYSTGALAFSSTTTAAYRFNVSGYKSVRARISAYSSGTVTVIGRAQANEGPMPQTNVALYGAGGTTAAGVLAAVDGQGAVSALAVSPQGNLFNGTSWDKQRTPSVFKVVALTAATAETTIWTPAGGKKFRLMGMILTCGASSTLTFKDNTAGTTIFAARGLTDTPFSPANMGNGILSSAANQPLTVTRGTSCTLDGVVFGTEE